MAIMELIGVVVAIKASIIGGIAYKSRKGIKNAKTRQEKDTQDSSIEESQKN